MPIMLYFGLGEYVKGVGNTTTRPSQDVSVMFGHDRAALGAFIAGRFVHCLAHTLDVRLCSCMMAMDNRSHFYVSE